MIWHAPFSLDVQDILPFDEAIQTVEAALRFGVDPSLYPCRRVLDVLGHPELSYKRIQIAGTNGKTSTTCYTASLLSTLGFKVGRYTSPHLAHYTERVAIDGTCVGASEFALGISYALCAWRKVCEQEPDLTKQGITEFELLTCAAFVIFALENVDYAVLEVGLGGRWDATSVSGNDGCVICGIGFDHMAVLGNTLSAIAREKASVIQPGTPVVLGVDALRPPEVSEVMLEACEAARVRPWAVIECANLEQARTTHELCNVACFEMKHSPAYLGDTFTFDMHMSGYLVEDDIFEAHYPDITLEAPAYQVKNAVCALTLVSALLGQVCTEKSISCALSSCEVSGRFQILRQDPLVLIDACHNPQSAAAFIDSFVKVFPQRSARPALLLGVLADKDYRGIIRQLVPHFDKIVATRSASQRALSALDLAREIKQTCGIECFSVQETLHGALHLLCGESFVACGTITLIGELTEEMNNIWYN